MQSNIKVINNNESFKLLNFSDDDKSSDLPDLDLPEISLQRKRKVKRKTRSRTPAKHVNGGREGACFQCKSFGLWAAVLMICSWLLIISYISSVVHAEYRRLEIELQKVSATSQHVPEALQKWHETSKALEQNQTSFLQNNIANFGSQITAFSGQIDKLTSDYAQLKEHQNHFNDTVLEIKTNFEASKNLTLPSVADNTTRLKLDTFIKSIEARFNNLSHIISSENETLTTSLKWFEDDLKNKTLKLNELSDNYLNISSHVLSVENLYTSNLSKQFESLQLQSSNLSGIIDKHEQLYQSQFESLIRQITEIQKRLDEATAATAKIENVVKPNKDEEKIFKTDSKSSSSSNNKNNNEPVIPLNSSGSQKQSSDNIDKNNNNLSNNNNNNNIKIDTEPSANKKLEAPTNTTFPAGLMQN
uniref:CSON015119 protein n=1 Tax=Culicoides sonorensis TaxID=179676 RepID=A0A336MCJ5_CULSO